MLFLPPKHQIKQLSIAQLVEREIVIAQIRSLTASLNVLCSTHSREIIFCDLIWMAGPTVELIVFT